MRTRLLLPRKLLRKAAPCSAAKPMLSADQHLLFAILVLAEGSHQVVPSWNHISQFLMPPVLYDRVHAAVCDVATLTTTSERKPRTKKLITVKTRI